MLKSLKQIAAPRNIRRQMQTERTTLDAWALHFGREAAVLWLEALSARDTAQLSNT